MKFSFEKGSVIRLFINSTRKYDFYGAVVSLNENEIVLRPQTFVLKEDVHGSRYYFSDFVPNVTIDDPHETDIHISRDIIIGWKYVKFLWSGTGEYTGWYPNQQYLEKVNELAIHRYNPRDHVCHGTGMYFEE